MTDDEDPTIDRPIPEWLSNALNRMPMPAAPIDAPWDFSAATLLAPALPGKLRRLPRLLDRFGSVRLSQESIGLDSTGPILWSDLLELRTRPLRDQVAEVAKDALGGAVGRMVQIPLARGQLVALTRATVDVVLGTLQKARRDRRDQAESAMVPFEIVYRTRLRRTKSASAGLVSAAVLSLPGVTASVLATAEQWQVPIKPVH